MLFLILPFFIICYNDFLNPFAFLTTCHIHTRPHSSPRLSLANNVESPQWFELEIKISVSKELVRAPSNQELGACGSSLETFSQGAYKAWVRLALPVFFPRTVEVHLQAFLLKGKENAINRKSPDQIHVPRNPFTPNSRGPTRAIWNSSHRPEILSSWWWQYFRRMLPS